MKENEIRFFGRDRKKIIYIAVVMAFVLGLIIRRLFRVEFYSNGQRVYASMKYLTEK